MAAALLVLLLLPVGSGLPPGFSVLDPANYAGVLRDDASWATQNVPFVDLSGAGAGFADVETAFYYRWRLYRKHLHRTPAGWIVSEWLGSQVPIPCAAGHHLAEGRWIHNTTYLDDSLRWWFQGNASTRFWQQRPRSYTSWLAWGAWQRHLVVGTPAGEQFMVSMLPALLENLRGWVREHRGEYGGSTVCFWQADGFDGGEVSISGDGCRPPLNSVIFGEAVALLQVAALAGNSSVVPELTTLREQARAAVLGLMWNSAIDSFATVPLPPPEPPAPPAPPPPPGFATVGGSAGSFCCNSPGCTEAVYVHRQYSGCTLEVAAGLCLQNFSASCNFITVHGNSDCFIEPGCNASGKYRGGGPTWTYRRLRLRAGDGQADKAVVPLAVTSMTSVVGTPVSIAPCAGQAAGALAGNGSCCPGNGSAPWRQNQSVSVRELLAFCPWYFALPGEGGSATSAGQLISPAVAEKYAGMWRQLFDPEGFGAEWGLRTAERRHPCYNYSYMNYSYKDTWNGPSWPYETARVLTAAANVLHDGYDSVAMLSSAEYVGLLQQFARAHTRSYAEPDTAQPKGSGHIYELLHPDDGYWVDHQLTGTEAGDDYNHSSFIDLVLVGLFGFRPRLDRTLTLAPLLPSTASHAAVDHVLYHGRMLAFVWDVDGSHYGVGSGLRILVDGETVAHSPTIARITAQLK